MPSPRAVGAACGTLASPPTPPPRLPAPPATGLHERRQHGRPPAARHGAKPSGAGPHADGQRRCLWRAVADAAEQQRPAARGPLPRHALCRHAGGSQLDGPERQHPGQPAGALGSRLRRECACSRGRGALCTALCSQPRMASLCPAPGRPLNAHPACVRARCRPHRRGSCITREATAWAMACCRPAPAACPWIVPSSTVAAWASTAAPLGPSSGDQPPAPLCLPASLAGGQAAAGRPSAALPPFSEASSWALALLAARGRLVASRQGHVRPEGPPARASDDDAGAACRRSAGAGFGPAPTPLRPEFFRSFHPLSATPLSVHVSPPGFQERVSVPPFRMRRPPLHSTRVLPPVPHPLRRHLCPCVRSPPPTTAEPSPPPLSPQISLAHSVWSTITGARVHPPNTPTPAPPPHLRPLHAPCVPAASTSFPHLPRIPPRPAASHRFFFQQPHLPPYTKPPLVASLAVAAYIYQPKRAPADPALPPVGRLLSLHLPAPVHPFPAPKFLCIDSLATPPPRRHGRVAQHSTALPAFCPEGTRACTPPRPHPPTHTPSLPLVLATNAHSTPSPAPELPPRVRRTSPIIPGACRRPRSCHLSPSPPPPPASPPSPTPPRYLLPPPPPHPRFPP